MTPRKYREERCSKDLSGNEFKIDYEYTEISREVKRSSTKIKPGDYLHHISLSEAGTGCPAVQKIQTAESMLSTFRIFDSWRGNGWSSQIMPLH